MTTETKITLKTLTIDEIVKILELKEIGKLIGAEETSFFEFKEVPYITTGTDSYKEFQKLELVKDISALANSGGGILCIGLKSYKPTGMLKEYVGDILPVKKEQITLDSWLDIISNMLVPLLPSGSMKYGYSGKEDELFWLHVPDASDLGIYPLLLVKDQWLPHKDVPIKGNVVGYYYRDGARVRQLHPEKIQKYIASGFDSENKSKKVTPEENLINLSIKELALKVDSITSQLDSLNKEVISGVPSNYDEKEKKMIEYANTKIGGDAGYFYLYAIPIQPVLINNFWEKDPDSIYELINKPFELRRYGWDLSTASIEFPYPKGSSWESTNGDRKLLNVSKNGEVFAAASLDGVLDWGVEKYEETSGEKIKLINLFALTEFIDIFFHFLLIFKMKFAYSTEFIVKFGFIYPKDINLKLHQPAHIQGLFSKTSETPTQTNGEIKVNKSVDDHPAYYAGEVATEINAAFGWTGDIPYTVTGEKGRMIDEELYIKKQSI